MKRKATDPAQRQQEELEQRRLLWARAFGQPPSCWPPSLPVVLVLLFLTAGFPSPPPFILLAINSNKGEA